MVVITGASSGLGREFALQYARMGKPLLLVARRGQRLETLAAQCLQLGSCQAEILALDLTSPGAEQQVLQALGERRLEVVVNNAGFGLVGAFLDAPPERLRAMLRLNVEAATMLGYLLGERMVRQGSGLLLNVASLGSFLPGSYKAVYFASKAYLLSWSEALQHEWKSSGVRVVTLCPGPVETEFQQVAGIEFRPAQRTMLMSAQAVVAHTLRAIDQGQNLVIPGRLNQLAVLLLGWLPRGWVASLGAHWSKMQQAKAKH